MNNLKRKVSLILSVIMIALAAFPLMTSLASTDSKYVSMSVKLEGKELEYAGTYQVSGGETVKVSASSKNADILFIAYYYENVGASQEERTAAFEARKKIYASSFEITIPKLEEGSKKILWVEAVDKKDDGQASLVTKTGWQAYYLEWKKAEEPTSSLEVNAKYDGKTLADRSTTTTAEPSDKIELIATPAEEAESILYRWDKDDFTEIKSAKTTITIPSTFAPGSTHYLYLVVKRASDGKYSTQKVYKFIIPESVEPVEPDDSELDILPWEKENKDLESLAIALRNDSEADKGNKSVYAIGEEVTYFVDFKNGGKNIKDVVKITLELPLDFEVVSSDGGNVDYDKGLITWTYPNGMEEEYEGTKTVVIKYKVFSKKSTDSMKIYPVATISKANKVADESAVINYIYRDEDTVITDTHEPYMYGDANATTFRPDAVITRAEGALVLTRILLGQSAIDNVKVTSVYPDLDQTYLEAQKAIIAATSYGIINGYTDGYYRPNQTMTRAEFMKIIAKFIEINAEDDGVKGLEIKNLEDSVKLYRDPVLRYAVNGTTVSNHWAIEEVTLLVRLNMTAVSSKNKNLRLDEGITRAEVAQLVNFFLLRAPADVTSRTTTAFSDVNKRHELFADIVEATRKAHDFTITEDGTEIAEY